MFGLYGKRTLKLVKNQGLQWCNRESANKHNSDKTTAWDNRSILWKVELLKFTFNGIFVTQDGILVAYPNTHTLPNHSHPQHFNGNKSIVHNLANNGMILSQTLLVL